MRSWFPQSWVSPVAVAAIDAAPGVQLSGSWRSGVYRRCFFVQEEFGNEDQSCLADRRALVKQSRRMYRAYGWAVDQRDWKLLAVCVFYQGFLLISTLIDFSDCAKILHVGRRIDKMYCPVARDLGVNSCRLRKMRMLNLLNPCGRMMLQSSAAGLRIEKHPAALAC